MHLHFCTPSGFKRRATGIHHSGFTLVELMVVVAIVAILASIALPSYEMYLKRSRAKSASADLVALSLNFENAYQRTLSYPESTNDVAKAKAGWAPTQTDFFTYSTESTTTTYTLTATGKGTLSSCTITLKHDNTRTASGGPCNQIQVW